MQKAIVTGGVGFIGTNLIKRLLSEGYEVISLDNYSTGKKENEIKGCTYYNIDISKPFKELSLMRRIFKNTSVIFHMAALARIQPSLKRPLESINANVNGTLTILEIARNYNIPVVYAGSSSFHHGVNKSPYAWSKYVGEEACELYSKVFNLNTSICRFYNVYGPYQLEEGEYSTVLGIFERQYRNNEPLTITGTGEQKRDFTHVDDIVDGLYKCSKGSFKGEIFELGRGKNFSINEVAGMFNAKTKYIPARKGEYPTTLCTDNKAKELLNWIPVKNLEDYIKNIIK